MNFKYRDPVIYLISGKSNSGKSTISSIIDNIYNKRRKKAINISFTFYIKEYAKNILNWDGNEDTKPRDFLQQIGIELIKTKINNKLLIDRIIDDIKVYSYFYDVITISDVRLKEEIEAIKNNFKKVKIIRVYRNSDNLTTKQKKHLTEIDLDTYKQFDFEIDNNKNIKEVTKIIENIIEVVENE